MVFFDIDQTLLDHRTAERHAALAFRERYAELAGTSAEAFVRLWHESAERHIQRYLAGEVSWRGQRRARLAEFWPSAEALADAELDALFETYLADYERAWTLYDDVRPCLDALAGRRLGVITNGGADAQRRKLIATGIADRFTVVVCSGDVGVAKPDPRIFAAACERAGADPADCTFVGDDPETDVGGALRAGMRAVWLNRDGSPGETAAPVIGSLAELKRILDGAGE